MVIEIIIAILVAAFIFWCFSDSKEIVSEEKFYIEYYSETGKYYPTYYGLYLKKNIYTGIVKTESIIDYADSFNTLEKALKLIDIFKEQKHKENVKKIPYGNRQSVEK